ncbi:T9SS type A sorting domain-containing protein [Dyadobacter tibetensis]|uniref:T9SS type A sorting domain-containing protein n=1 Tax=Dyadobacter tibetensis TaxID=1211851 RepID=UPI0004724222|nr:T9SS type A sorting domain-containing protein [Dyadobacter tibetensis]
MKNLKACNFKNAIVIVFLFLIMGTNLPSVFAQIKLVPIGFPTSQSVEIPLADTPGAQRQQGIDLPFFDDFSMAVDGRPHSQLWQSGSGVRINNTLTTGQPSINVATFDGLNANGAPYNFTNPLVQGFTDTLSCLPINLSAKHASDSIYLSYYWQSGELIEKPDSSDYIQLEFLDKDLQWHIVWKQSGYQTDHVFHHQFIAIKEDRWMHANFRFRFRTFGRSSGAYDMWHIDYLYLNSKRSLKDIYIRDLALTHPLSAFLKNYRAMPLSHYRVDPSRFTEKEISAEIRNLYNNENRTAWTLQVRDELSGKQFAGDQEGSSYIGPLQTLNKRAKLRPVEPMLSDTALRIKYSFKLETSDNQNPSIPSIDLTRNDTLSATAELSDFFAYDDGSAEYGIQVNQKLGRVAVRYVLAHPDTIGGVRMSILPFNKNVAGLSFTLQLWSNKGGRPDVLLAQQAFPASYSGNEQALKEYAFSKAIAVTDTFYVGWLQVSEQPLTVGYDLNSVYGAKQVLYNLGNSWVAADNLRGSIMLRPFLARSGAELITGVKATESVGYFYPNPAPGLLQWKGDSLDAIEIYDSTGRRVGGNGAMRTGDFLDFKELSAGMYYFKCYHAKGIYVQKILKQ